MNLREIRNQFVFRSGRYDLITEDGEDFGADFFIQAATRMLDRRANLRHTSVASSLLKVAEDDRYIQVPDCWLITGVDLMMDWGERWWPLKQRHTRGKIREIFPNVCGTPASYAVTWTRHVPTVSKMETLQADIPADLFTNAEWAFSLLTLELMPAPIQESTLRVTGRFFSEPLIEDEDTNLWSMQHPDILLKACLYQLETFYRNSDGQTDWIATIDLDLRDLEFLEIEQDVQHISVMEG